MAGKQVTELDALPSFTDTSLLPVHNGAGLKKGSLSQLVTYLGNKFSNPNLLINPNFKINQRGSVNYAKNGYTVDRWKITNGIVKPQSNGIIVTLNNEGLLTQSFENALSGTYTATIKVTSITGDCVLSIGSHSLQLNKAGTFSITENGSIADISLRKTTGTCTIAIEWIKLEQGSVATHFVEPNKADELLKCQRYYEKMEVLLGRLVINTSQNFSASYKSKFYRVLNGSYRAEKRTTPTISVKGSLTNTSNGALGVSASDFKSDAKSFRQFTVSAETNYVDVFITNAEIDAEIY